MASELEKAQARKADDGSITLTFPNGGGSITYSGILAREALVVRPDGKECRVPEIIPEPKMSPEALEKAGAYYDLIIAATEPFAKLKKQEKIDGVNTSGSSNLVFVEAKQADLGKLCPASPQAEGKTPAGLER